MCVEGHVAPNKFVNDGRHRQYADGDLFLALPEWVG